MDKHLKNLNFDDKIQTFFSEEGRQNVISEIEKFERKPRNRNYLPNILSILVVSSAIFFGGIFVLNEFESDSVENSNYLSDSSTAPDKITTPSNEENNDELINLINEIKNELIVFISRETGLETESIEILVGATTGGRIHDVMVSVNLPKAEIDEATVQQIIEDIIRIVSKKENVKISEKNIEITTVNKTEGESFLVMKEATSKDYKIVMKKVTFTSAKTEINFDLTEPINAEELNQIIRFRLYDDKGNELEEISAGGGGCMDCKNIDGKITLDTSVQYEPLDNIPDYLILEPYISSTKENIEELRIKIPIKKSE